VITITEAVAKMSLDAAFCQIMSNLTAVLTSTRDAVGFNASVEELLQAHRDACRTIDSNLSR
jgi:hypothetical protein